MNNQKEGSYTAKLRTKSIILFIVCIILTLICLLPIYILIVNATRSDSQITSSVSLIPGSQLVANYNKIFDTPEFSSFRPLIGFRNSAIIAVGATFLTVFFSALTAYGLVVYDFKLRSPAYTFILAVMMVPVQVTSVGFVQFMISLKLHDSFIPLIIPAIAAPAVVFFMRQYLKSSFPLSIVEAARIDGCGEFRTFLTIAIPLMKPAIAVQSIFAFVANWNNYYTPSMILISGKVNKLTMPMMVSIVSTNDHIPAIGAKYMAIAISIIPIIVVYLILSKYIVAGVALGGVKE